MKYILRDYQKEASDKAVEFLLDKNKNGNGLLVLATGAGKSLVIADIAHRLQARVLVFQPSKEILEQNYAKMCSYGVECSKYSASVGKRVISNITFATIGSVKNKTEEFKDFDYIIVDEAHLVNPDEGMYRNFFKKVKKRIVGLTATPYRLATEGQTWDFVEKTWDFSECVSMLIPIVGEGQIFDEVLYTVDTEYLLSRGYLAYLKYYYTPCRNWENLKMYKNAKGSEFTDSSIKYAMEHTDFRNHTINILRRLLRPKSGKPRNGILVFVHDITEGEEICSQVDSCRIVTGEFTKKNREEVLRAFENREFQILVNVGTLIVGYDRPDLDTVVLATPTMSLARYYQEVGRAIRPCEGKDAWIVDLVGNKKRFGEVHKLKFLNVNGVWDVYNDERKLTNTEL